MSKTPNYDAKVKVILDSLSPGERVCSMTGEKWMMTEEEIGWYKKFNVPPSKVSPQTRWKHQGYWYVGYQFWYQKHPETQKPIICTVHPATGIKVLPDQEWFEKDFIQKARDYDVAQSFFEQWRELELAVPMPALRNQVEPINSIAFVSRGDENSYFVGASKSRNCIYSHICTDIEDSAWIYLGINVQRSYNVVRSVRIHNSRYVRESIDCINSFFLFDCRNCENCFGATNKRNAKYLWFNEQLSKEEWEKRVSEVDLGSRAVEEEYMAKFNQLISEAVWPENFNDNVTDSDGEYLIKTVGVKETFGGEEGAKNLYRCNFSIGTSENCAFSGYPVYSTDCYYIGSCTRCNDMRYSFLCTQCNGMEYSALCYNCEYCFGCIGLQRKKFCIFNKQYSEEEYWKRVDELKCAMLDAGEYGEFFPVNYAPSYHRDSGAPIWFGASEEDGIGMGVNDFDPESHDAIGRNLSTTEPTDSSQVPDHINDLGDEWINKPLLDTQMNRRFAMIKSEVNFYRKNCIAPPTGHHIGRMNYLLGEANRGLFVEARCEVCSKDLMVADNLNHPNRKIYCREDYLKFIETNG